MIMEKGDLKIDKNTVVHCTTEELANQVLAIANNLGYKWKYGDSYTDYNLWNHYREQTCYNLTDGSFCNIDFYKSMKYNIIETEDFLKLHENNEAKTITSDIEWEQRRYEIAKSVLQGLVGDWSNTPTSSSMCRKIEMLADLSISIADEMIKQLKDK